MEIYTIHMMFLAFLGGIILNFMPCVFPIISLKVYSLINKNNTKINNLFYFIGIIFTFFILICFFIFLKLIGIDINWGMQFQYPVFVIIMSVLFLILGLSMCDVFTFNPLIPSSLNVKNQKLYNFYGGIISVLASTPCTAPYMSVALGYAFSSNILNLCLIIFSLGVGFGLPVMCLSFIPGLYKLMPRSGKWLLIFKRILSIPLFITAIWFGFVFIQQVTVDIIPSEQTTQFEEFNIQKLNQYKLENKKVFVEITSSWCATCITNEKMILNTNEIQNFFKNHDIIYMRGDITVANKDIDNFMKQYKKYAVPFYIYFVNNHYIIFSEILTKNDIKTKIKMEEK